MLKRFGLCAGLALLCATMLIPTAYAGDAGGIKHYLVMGFDFWGDERIGTSYTDVNMIVSVDAENGRVLLTSLMRDSYMTLPDGSNAKLNNIVRKHDFATYVQTVENALGITAEGYVAIGAPGFARMVGAIGGVEVTITEAEYEAMGGTASEVPGPGTHRLRGNAVYAYVRIRSTGGGDGERTERARNVMIAMIKQLHQVSVGELLALAQVAVEEVKTDISILDIFEMLVQIHGMEKLSPEELRLPIPGQFLYDTAHGSSIVRWQWEENVEAYNDFLENGAQPER